MVREQAWKSRTKKTKQQQRRQAANQTDEKMCVMQLINQTISETVQVVCLMVAQVSFICLWVI